MKHIPEAGGSGFESLICIPTSNRSSQLCQTPQFWSDGMDPFRYLREAVSFAAVRGGTSMKIATVGLDIAKLSYISALIRHG